MSHWLLVVVILLVALFFRAYNLDRVPPGLEGDEIFNAWDGLQAWKRPFTVFVPTNYGSETMLIYLIALTTRLLGVGAWTVRLPSAISGIVGLALTWSLTKRLFNHRVAVLTTALTAISVWPILLNRIALRACLQPVCQVAAVYGLWRALEERSNGWAVVGGVFTGLTLYTYTPSRAFPVFVVCWLSVAWIIARQMLHGNGKRLVLLALIAILVFLPLGLYALRHPEIYNERVRATDSDLRQLLSGNPEPVLRSLDVTLRMFTQVGDANWRYNPPGRPVFDKVTGGLFYLGLVVSLWRLRRPAYSLMLIWLAVMLLPSILGNGSPSFWRAVGALTPIYLMPAIGADFLWERIAHWSHRFDRQGLVVRLGLPAITMVGLAFVGADAWHDYFDQWARDPRVLHTHGADMAAAGRYLNEHTLADTLVWVSSDYPGDMSRIALDLQSTYSGPVRWFDGNKVTVWPSGWAGQDVMIIFTQSSPPNSDAVSVLSDYLVFQEDNAVGEPHLWVYQIPGGQLSQVPWEPECEVSGRFARNREILGYDIPTEVRRQTSVPVIIYWRVPPGVEYVTDDLPQSFVCLRDHVAGRCLEDVPPHYNAYPIWDWTEGDVVAQRYMVPVPAQLLPQTTAFHVGMFTSVGEISYADEERAGAPLLLGPVEVVGTATVDPQWDSSTPIFGQELALIDYGMPTERSPGSTLRVWLRWQAIRPPSGDRILRLDVREAANGEVVISEDELLGSDRHPTGRWVGGEPAYTLHRLRIPPDLGNGEFDVTLTLLDVDSQRAVESPLALGRLSISGRPHYFELPTPQHPLIADFGSDIRLLGFDLKNVNATGGGQIDLVLYWQALDTVDRDYKVFVHLYQPTIPGGLSGQHDSPPGNGALPTSSWLSGEVVTDSHLVSIEQNADAGLSEIGVGLYLSSTGERLPVSVEGQAQPDNVLILTQVEVR
jgi:4-amino-4-deoxy-L-arabinose transferase-like glycosyltransferase